MLKRLICFPFETGVAAYIIVNALLTFNPNSAVLMSLWNIIGGFSIAAMIYQIFAGLAVILGMLTAKANIELMGLIMVCSTLSIRGYALLLDGDITLTDLNSSCLATLAILASATRIYTLYMNQCKSRV